MNLRPPIGRSGRAVIAGADGVLINEHLARPAATTILRVSELPYLVPVLEQSFDHPDYVLVVVDHSGADITTHIGGTLRSETVDGTGYPVHKAAGAETAGYGDPSCAPRRRPGRTSAPSPTASPSWPTTRRST